VRRRLAENDLKPWRRDMWCIPHVDGEYVARMEDVLDLYAEPPYPARPLICFDEWVWPRRWPRRSSRSIQRQPSHSPSPVPAVAVECSSSRPSMPAASHATGQPPPSSKLGSTPHERGRHVSHPHRQSRFPLVTIRPRRRSTEQLPGSAFNKASSPKKHRHRGSSEPETHRRPLSPHGRALAS